MKVYFLNRVENIVAKREIAHYEQFIVLPQCFQKSSAAEVLESVSMWEMVNPYRAELQHLISAFFNFFWQGLVFTERFMEILYQIVANNVDQDKTARMVLVYLGFTFFANVYQELARKITNDKNS